MILEGHQSPEVTNPALIEPLNLESGLVTPPQSCIKQYRSNSNQAQILQQKLTILAIIEREGF